jgi:hypothetical protein
VINFSSNFLPYWLTEGQFQAETLRFPATPQLCHQMNNSPTYCTPRRTVSQLENRSFWVMPTGGMPDTISTYGNSVTRLFSKMAARGENCRSFDVIASPRPVVFPLFWKVVFFELWQCFAWGVIWVVKTFNPSRLKRRVHSKRREAVSHLCNLASQKTGIFTFFIVYVFIQIGEGNSFVSRPETCCTYFLTNIGTFHPFTGHEGP